MKLRYRLADWISGGELSKARRECVVVLDGGVGYVTRASIAADNVNLCKALRRIAAEAKRGKNPNATVRRMGKWAEEAVNEMGDGL